MTVTNETMPKPIYRVLTKLTHQHRPDVALSIAVKDLVRLRLKEVSEERQVYEQKYGVDFETFKTRFLAGLIPNSYSYEVEKDYWEWEGAVTNEAALIEMRETLA